MILLCFNCVAPIEVRFHTVMIYFIFKGFFVAVYAASDADILSYFYGFMKEENVLLIKAFFLLALSQIIPASDDEDDKCCC